MAAHHDTWTWTGTDGVPLFCQSWTPPIPRALLCIVHGMGEHSGRYAAQADRFTAAGISVYAYDHRGHGRSGGPRGHTPHYDALLDGVDYILTEARKRGGSGLPLFAWGHSMGGNIVLAHALRRQPAVAGIIATAPFLKLPKEPPALQLALARGMDRIFPAFSQPTKLDPSRISRDPAEVQAYIQDPLVHDRISTRWFLSCTAAAEDILAGAAEISVPLLLMHGSGDGIVSVRGSRAFSASAAASCTYVEFEDAYHELHNDVIRTEALDRMCAFIDAHCAPATV